MCGRTVECLVAVVLVLSAGGIVSAGQAPAGADAAASVPPVVRDESAADWVVDRFVGNSTTGVEFYQGPATEIGGVAGGGVRPKEGGGYFVNAGAVCAEIRPDGTLIQIRPQDAAPELEIKNGAIVRNTRGADGSLKTEILAGTPGKFGQKDGPAGEALLCEPHDFRGMVHMKSGVIYWLECYPGLRKLENGVVTTLALKFTNDPKRFAFNLGGAITGGEDENTLYIADGYGHTLRRVNLTSLEVTRVCFPPLMEPDARKKFPEVRWERTDMLNADGPAMTHASVNSGCFWAYYDPIHKAVWLGGPDERRLRWFRLSDGWVKTVIGSGENNGWTFDSPGTPADKANIAWAGVSGFDGKGGMFFSTSSHKHGIWHAYNKKEVKP